jgi:phosphate uptake regulator
MVNIISILTGAKPPLIREAVAHVDAMLDTSARMLAAATGLLLYNEPLELDLTAEDATINAREQDVRRLVVEHLAVDPDRELSFSLVLVAAVQEAERLGDIAKTLAQVASLAKGPRLGAAAGPLRDLARKVLSMSEDTRKAFLRGQVGAAQRVSEQHAAIKEEVKGYLQALAAQEQVSPNEAVVYALAARLLGRCSSHLANIVSSVIVPFDQIRRPAAG